MWIAHLSAVSRGGAGAWLGLVIVVQNAVSSLFNSHLFDFFHGWLYVFGVGVLGGMALRARATRRGKRACAMTIALPQRARILVVALRRLGDVLLTTPLNRSLKHAWPDATIDVLVFAGTQGILAGNPDIATVLTIPARPGTGRNARAAAQAVAPLRSRRLDPERRPSDILLPGCRQHAASASSKRRTCGRARSVAPDLSGGHPAQ
jgi:hypothetical protein